MSIQERKEYGEAIALIERHGMVAVTQERMQRLLAVVEVARSLSETCQEILPAGAPEAVCNFYGDTYELADALAALGEE